MGVLLHRVQWPNVRALLRAGEGVLDADVAVAKWRGLLHSSGQPHVLRFCSKESLLHRQGWKLLEGIHVKIFSLADVV